MTRESQQSLVDEQVGVLVKHFGVARVRAALVKASNGGASEGQVRTDSTKRRRQTSPTVTSMLEQVQRDNEAKYYLLNSFYTRLKDRMVLPESQDIRHFALLIGLKDIKAKSRKDMVPKLMRFLIDQPTERLQVHIEKAPKVSEQQRQKGFSVITDKLLGERPITESGAEETG